MSFNVAEEWRPVIGLDTDFSDYYEVSNTGRIKSLDRFIDTHSGGSYVRKGAILNPNINTRGYYLVDLRKKGVRKAILLHSLIAFAWLEPCPGIYAQRKGCFNIDHIDHDRLNNRVDNLRWLSVEQNSSQGTVKGERSGRSKLTEKDIIDIRSSNLSYKELSRIYNIKAQSIQLIIQGVNWKHVDYPNKEEQLNKRKLGVSKLLPDQIFEILLDNNTSLSNLAKKHKVSYMTIHRIKNNPTKYLKDMDLQPN